MDVEHLEFKLGKKLTVDELSESKAYAIVSESKGVVLRASLFKDGAEIMRDASRSVHELWLFPATK